ncbi:unnamed protein product [Acanthoscelides obtectus]|uniref:Uncharacterized protein n=1 Tax=Acanthoscelides obtectus TaxID=200917 RepID=A0A9P0MCB0_ACAOB|nr:unnamed protein product [Acanthoscelides obtectus]CAK1660214.1 hypothetical protein AOBTE_LOCUS21915 [Acanthoscelides obtectus]
MQSRSSHEVPSLFYKADKNPKEGLRYQTDQFALGKRTVNHRSSYDRGQAHAASQD